MRYISTSQVCIAALYKDTGSGFALVSKATYGKDSAEPSGGTIVLSLTAGHKIALYCYHNGGSGKNLVVKEIIVPQAGTLLSVVYDNKVVYQTYMGRRQVPLDEKVQQAIVLVLDAVANASIDSRSPDLAGDEW